MVYLLTVFLLEPASFGEVLPAVMLFVMLLLGIFAASYFTSWRAFLIPYGRWRQTVFPASPAGVADS